MNIFEEGLGLLNEKFGNGKDNIISFATIDLETTPDGRPRPVVREVDACYDDGFFYVVTYGKSSKMLQVAANDAAAIAVSGEWFTANGVATNLGWVLDPKNTELRTKLRTVFAAWYDFANDENDPNCCILAIRLEKGILNIGHFEKLYHLDFVAKTATLSGRSVS